MCACVRPSTINNQAAHKSNSFFFSKKQIDIDYRTQLNIELHATKWQTKMKTIWTKLNQPTSSVNIKTTTQKQSTTCYYLLPHNTFYYFDMTKENTDKHQENTINQNQFTYFANSNRNSALIECVTRCCFCLWSHFSDSFVSRMSANCAQHRKDFIWTAKQMQFTDETEWCDLLCSAHMIFIECKHFDMLSYSVGMHGNSVYCNKKKVTI